MMDFPKNILRSMLKEMRQAYEAGDRSKLITAIRFCGRHQLLMPDWVVDEFHKKTNKWYNYKVKEIGEALGLQWPKGAHISALRKKRYNKHHVHSRITELKQRGRAIDENLFAEVGKELGLGKTLVSEYYYDVEAILRSTPPSIEVLLGPKFRKK